MPPFVARKRARSSSPAAAPVSAKGKAAAKPAKRSKRTAFDAVDAPTQKQKTIEENRKLLDELNGDDDDESLSEADSDDFEDVPPAKRRKTSPVEDVGVDEEEEEEDEMDWEDAMHQPTLGTSTAQAEREIADVSFTIQEDGSYVDPGVSIPGLSKKGPSKRERQARIQTHCLHVQALMWHNTVRNSWLNDKEVQKLLVDGLTEGVKREVTRWREAMGMLSKEELEAKKKAAAAKGKGKRGRKGKEKSGRDWSYEAEHQEQGVPNLSAGDPLLRLLKVLTAYWRKRFTITAPGLRKQGFMPLRRLREEIKGWEKSRGDAEEHGERIESVDQFRKLARKCEGSRDVGAQLFAALLRGLGLETRMVVNLQPSGFGWSKGEEADENKLKKKDGKAEKAESDSEAESQDAQEKVKPKAGAAKKTKAKLKNGNEKPTRQSSRGNKAEPIDLEDSDSSLSEPPSADELVEVEEDGDDFSVVDVTPSTPKKKPNKKYDRDLAFPNYWIEVCSPVSKKYIPVDPIVLSTIASNDELLQTFEPRGKKAEKSKQVMAYTIAFSADGTAKDVTVRYLKKHQLPGKTKGMRMPVEKVPVYNRKGKVRRYEEYDWFRTVMSLYDRPEKKRTAADDLEEQTDLKPFKPAKQEKEVEKESLQWYKQSAEFVLEQHLRREEAIVPGAKPVKQFTAGKGDKAKEHPVYRRKDVLPCKTVESWHKEGRAIKVGQQPMKLVPMRAVTLIRKREMEDAQRETGEKLKQGLYSVNQTDWIIPPPIKDGIIPKNAFGNMDVYVPTMVPTGAVHLPLKGSAKLCRKLEIDYAEACTGFEFGKQRAVPVLTGVVVADEHEMLVRDAWRAEQKEIKRKEDTKRTGAALHWWRKMLLGLRVLERMRVEYADAGGGGEEVNPFVQKAKREGRNVSAEQAAVGAEGEVESGGFFLPGHDEEEVPQHRGAVPRDRDDEESGGGGGFFAEDEEGHDDVDVGGGFLVEEDEDEPAKQSRTNHAPITPVSLQSMHKATDGVTEDDDTEMQDAPAEQPAARRSATKASKVKAKPTRKAVPPLSEDEAEDSSLSELNDASEQHEDLVSDSESDVSPANKSNKRTSPQVVVTPRAAGRGRKAAPASTRSTRGKRNIGKKATPLKSQYFADSDDESAEGGGDGETEDEQSEAEIVKPSRTTARTRARG